MPEKTKTVEMNSVLFQFRMTPFYYKIWEKIEYLSIV